MTHFIFFANKPLFFSLNSIAFHHYRYSSLIILFLAFVRDVNLQHLIMLNKLLIIINLITIWLFFILQICNSQHVVLMMHQMRFANTIYYIVCIIFELRWIKWDMFSLIASWTKKIYSSTFYVLQCWSCTNISCIEEEKKKQKKIIF